MKDKYFITFGEIRETDVAPERRDDKIVKAFLSGLQQACKLFLTSEAVEVEFIDQSYISFNVSNGNKNKVDREVWKPMELPIGPINMTEGQIAQLFHTSFIKVSGDAICDVYYKPSNKIKHLSARLVGIPPAFLLGVIKGIPENKQIFVRIVRSGDKFQLELAEYVCDFFGGRKIVKEFDESVTIQLDTRLKPVITNSIFEVEEGKMKVVPLKHSFRLYNGNQLILEIPREEVHYSLVKPLLDNEHKYGGRIATEVLLGDSLYLVSYYKDKPVIYYHPLFIPKQQIS